MGQLCSIISTTFRPAWPSSAMYPPSSRILTSSATFSFKLPSGTRFRFAFHRFPADLLLDELQGAERHVRVRLREQARRSAAEGEEGSRASPPGGPEGSFDEAFPFEDREVLQRRHLRDAEGRREVGEGDRALSFQGEKDLLLGRREARLETAFVDLRD